MGLSLIVSLQVSDALYAGTVVSGWQIDEVPLYMVAWSTDEVNLSADAMEFGNGLLVYSPCPGLTPARLPAWGPMRSRPPRCR